MARVDIDKAGIEEMFKAIPRSGRGERLWWFQFGPYARAHGGRRRTGTNVFVWGGSLEDGLEVAAAWVAENAPGHLTPEEEMPELYEEAAEELGVPWPIDDWDDPDAEKVREQAEVDMTYTKSGWLNNSEWYVTELNEGDLYAEVYGADDLYAEVWEASIDELAEEGDLNDDDIEEVNAFAQKLGLDAEWEMD